MRRLLIILAGAAALSACATAAPYGPAMSPTGQGWTVQPIQNDRARVSYRGLGPPEQVYDFALLRAAELTQERGYEWFEVDMRGVDAGYPGGARPSVGVSGGSSRWGGYRSSGVGVGIGVNLSPGAPSTVSLEIRMGRGARPDSPDAYDAADVQRTIAPRVR